jgi:hypothetical protein
MKINLASTALAACLILSLSAPAHAGFSGTEMVRVSQMRMADLGYYAGRYDGVVGPSTEAGLKSFQRRNGLPTTGKLTTETYDLLLAQDYRKNHTTAAIDAEPVLMMSPPPANLTENGGWQYMDTKTMDSRYGQININEDGRDGVVRFTLTLNNRPFLRADNQPGSIRVSKVFELNSEDAMIITTYRGEADCEYRNYLVTIRDSSTEPAMREFESCAPSSEVHSAFQALFVRFPGTMNKDGWSSWDVWRYENATLHRL